MMPTMGNESRKSSPRILVLCHEHCHTAMACHASQLCEQSGLLERFHIPHTACFISNFFGPIP